MSSNDEVVENDGVKPVKKYSFRLEEINHFITYGPTLNIFKLASKISFSGSNKFVSSA